MAEPTTGLYEEDLYCSNPNNLIQNEVQTLQVPATDEYYFIIPHAAPFYLETLEVRNHHTGALYVEGVDYLVGHRFIDAMQSLKRPVAGSIRFLRRNITGIVRLKYHTLGGQWGYNSGAILQELSAKLINPITRSWDQIEGFPVRFPSIAHDQSVDRLVGSEHIRDSIERIADVLAAASAGSTEQHVNDRNNPHRVNKEQVDLGNVLNYGIASLVEALSDTISTKYMTPQTTNHAILKKAIEPLNAFIARRDNPNQVTKDQTGLGRVPNLALATDAQAIDPLNNQAFMSPYTTALMIQSVIPLGRIDEIDQRLTTFIARRDNPNQVTAAQVGTLTEAEIRALVGSGTGGGGGGDADTLNGYTLAQISTFFADTEEVELVADTINEIYVNSTLSLGDVEASLIDDHDVEEINQYRDLLVVDTVEAGAGGYIAGQINGIMHSVGSFDFDVSGIPARFGKQVVFNHPHAWYIDEKGGVIALGDSPNVHNDFNGNYINFDTANAVTQLTVTNSARYMLINDGRLIRSTGPANQAQINTGVTSVWSNREYGEAGELVIYTKAGDVFAYGNATLTSSFNTVKAQLTAEGLVDSIYSVVIGYNHLIIMFSHVTEVPGDDDENEEVISYSVKVYQFDHSNNRALVEVASNFDSPSAISGYYGHSCVLSASGRAHFFGDLKACEDEIEADITNISCGREFTVFVDIDGSVEFWGDDPENKLNFDYIPDYEVPDVSD